MRKSARRANSVIGTLPSELVEQFEATDLIGHYRLSGSRMAVPRGWLDNRIGEWQLVHEQTLPSLRITVGDRPIGWLLGYPVDSEGTLVRRDIQLPAHGISDGYDVLEDILYSFAGRYVAFFLGSAAPRAYLDPMGSLGILFCPSQGIAASSPFLIPYTSETGDRFGLIEALSFPGSHLSLPFGLTPRHGIDWLMPNHHLDLSEWHTERHWPRGEFEPSHDPGPLVAEIIRALEKNIGAVVDNGAIQMSLTAGRDSRMLLACARRYVSDISFVTLDLPDGVGKIDRNVAPRMARKLKLDHRIIPARKASAHAMKRYAYRTGCMVWDPRAQRAVRTMSQLDPGRPYVMGLCGEVGRAYRWQADDRETTAFGLEEYLVRRGIPSLPEIVDKGRQWFDRLPVENTLTILDLLQVEQETGGYDSWFAFGFPDAGLFHFHPFNDRRIIDAFLRLPGEYKREQRLTDDVVAGAWPELAEFPYNQAIYGVHGMYRRLRRRAKDLVTALRGSSEAPSQE